MKEEMLKKELQIQPELVYAIEYVYPVIYRSYLKKPLTEEELNKELCKNSPLFSPLIDADYDEQIDIYTEELEVLSYICGNELRERDLNEIKYRIIQNHNE